MKKRSFRSTLSRVGICYFTMMLLTQLLQLVLSVLFMEQMTSGGWWTWLLSYLPLYCVSVPVFVWMMHKLIPGKADVFGTATLPFRGGVRWFFLCLGITYICNYVSILVLAGIAAIKGSEVVNPLAVMVDASSWLATLLFGCIVAPVGEEFLFRKLLYDKIGQYGIKVYVLTGSFIFAMFHANLSQLLYAFILGMVFCYIYAYTGKLIYTILLHIAINTVGSLLMPLLAGMGDVGVMAVGILVLVLIVVGIVLGVRKRWRFAPETAPVMAEDAPEMENAGEATADLTDAEPAKRVKKDVSHTFGGALRTPGMIAYTVLCVLLIAVVTVAM